MSDIINSDMVNNIFGENLGGFPDGSPNGKMGSVTGGDMVSLVDEYGGITIFDVGKPNCKYARGCVYYSVVDNCAKMVLQSDDGEYQYFGIVS
jgi:hypothetical protein